MSILKITLLESEEELCFELEASESDRWDHFGFGTFLCDVKKGEVEITEAAMVILRQQPERIGLQGIEFWKDKRLAWASPDQSIIVPCKDTNVPRAAQKWIKDLFTITKEQR